MTLFDSVVVLDRYSPISLEKLVAAQTSDTSAASLPKTKSDEMQIQILQQLIDSQLDRDNLPIAQLEKLRAVLVSSLRKCNEKIDSALGLQGADAPKVDRGSRRKKAASSSTVERKKKSKKSSGSRKGNKE